jgi:hypothetical protein
MANSQSTHSKLSFSGRSRWRACPLSVHLSHGLPDGPSSPAAAEGTGAHLVAEWYVRQAFNLPLALPGECPDVTRTPGLAIEGDAAWAAWQDQLRKHGKDYLAFVRTLIPADEPNAYVSVETPVNIASIHAQLFGTLDLRIWLPVRRILIVVDYKYGFQDVDVGTPDDPNAQLAAYAIASIEALTPALRDSITSVWLAVYQPRVPLGDPAKILRLAPSWIDVERAKLREEVKAVESPGGPRPGDHCRYCPAKGVCPAVHNALQTALDAYAGGRNILAMDDAEIIALWSARKAVETLMGDVDERVRKLAKDGDSRFKVTVREGRRMWRDAKSVAMTLLAIGRHDLLQPVALSEAIAALPPGIVDELVGKSQGSTYISLLEERAPNVVRDIFAAYVKRA